MPSLCAGRPSKEKRRMDRQEAASRILKDQKIAEKKKAREEPRLVDAQPEPELQPEPEPQPEPELQPESETFGSYSGPHGHIGMAYEEDNLNQKEQSSPLIETLEVLIPDKITDIRDKYKRKLAEMQGKDVEYPLSFKKEKLIALIMAAQIQSKKKKTKEEEEEEKKKLRGLNVNKLEALAVAAGVSNYDIQRELEKLRGKWNALVTAYGNEIKNIINGRASGYGSAFKMRDLPMFDKIFKVGADESYKALKSHWGIDLRDLDLDLYLPPIKSRKSRKTGKTKKKRKKRKTRKKTRKTRKKKN